MSAKRWIKIERVYAGDDGLSHFEDLWFPLEENLDHPAPSIAGESIGPVTALVDANTSDCTPAARAASSTPCVPATLVANVRSGRLTVLPDKRMPSNA